MYAIARSFVLLVAFVTGLASLAAPIPVLAQDNGVVIIPVASPVAGETILITNDPTAIALDPAMVLALVLVLLLVALFALSEIFRYLRDGREDYYKTFRELARKGVYATPVMVDATATQEPALRLAESGAILESDVNPALFRVSGPGVVVAGQSGTFTATLNEAPADGTLWELSASDGTPVSAQSATLEPATGGSATFTGLKPGSYRLRATPADPNLSMVVETAITVVEPPVADGDGPMLPFIGEGYGSIVGAILLLAVVVVLATTRAIDADIIGVLLGSIAGYLFGVGINRSTS